MSAGVSAFHHTKSNCSVCNWQQSSKKPGDWVGCWLVSRTSTQETGVCVPWETIINHNLFPPTRASFCRTSTGLPAAHTRGPTAPTHGKLNFNPHHFPTLKPPSFVAQIYWYVCESMYKFSYLIWAYVLKLNEYAAVSQIHMFIGIHILYTLCT